MWKKTWLIYRINGFCQQIKEEDDNEDDGGDGGDGGGVMM